MKRSNASQNIRFWCAVGTVKQMAFREDATTYEVDKEMPIGEQHILYQSVLMCGKSRDGIKKYRKTKKQKTVQLRIENVPLCKGCEKNYKANPNLAYSKWIVAARGTGKTEMVKEAFLQELHGVTAS